MNKLYWQEKEVKHKERGLVKAYPFSTHRSLVKDEFYIEKHRYHTNRGAIIELWDLYIGTELRGDVIKSFTTLKAAKDFINYLHRPWEVI